MTPWGAKIIKRIANRCFSKFSLYPLAYKGLKVTVKPCASTNKGFTRV